jgi:hypothetical protein
MTDTKSSTWEIVPRVYGPETLNLVKQKDPY